MVLMLGIKVSQLVTQGVLAIEYINRYEFSKEYLDWKRKSKARYSTHPQVYIPVFLIKVGEDTLAKRSIYVLGYIYLHNLYKPHIVLSSCYYHYFHS